MKRPACTGDEPGSSGRFDSAAQPNEAGSKRSFDSAARPAEPASKRRKARRKDSEAAMRRCHKECSQEMQSVDDNWITCRRGCQRIKGHEKEKGDTGCDCTREHYDFLMIVIKNGGGHNLYGSEGPGRSFAEEAGWVNITKAMENWKRLAKGMKRLEDYKHKKKIVIEHKEKTIREIKLQMEKKKEEAIEELKKQHEKDVDELRRKEKGKLEEWRKKEEQVMAVLAKEKEETSNEERVIKEQLRKAGEDLPSGSRSSSSKDAKEKGEKEEHPRAKGNKETIGRDARREAALNEKIQEVRVLAINGKGMQVYTSRTEQEGKSRTPKQRITREFHEQQGIIREFLEIAEGKTRIRIMKEGDTKEIEEILNCINPHWSGGQILQKMEKVQGQRCQEEKEAEEREQDVSWQTAWKWHEKNGRDQEKGRLGNCILIMVLKIGGGFNLYGSEGPVEYMDAARLPPSLQAKV